MHVTSLPLVHRDEEPTCLRGSSKSLVRSAFIVSHCEISSRELRKAQPDDRYRAKKVSVSAPIAGIKSSPLWKKGDFFIRRRNDKKYYRINDKRESQIYDHRVSLIKKEKKTSKIHSKADASSFRSYALCLSFSRVSFINRSNYCL